ncbi:GFA family protein [Vitreoscilla massiliensis]|uniref:GFA family protein n=1 Tax=Vitreoscilla massiliensis TaxID=1689272 RepID=A0ABY4E5P9_9NEIS|nr:GFA family protein [Vitreoscilla massiliensis]UOO89658.1 GFA family protein [Vitreoscilla massiliensis]
MKTSGQCLCGQVAFALIPTSLQVGVCHCNMCRRQNSGPSMSLEYVADSLEYHQQDSVQVYDSSTWGQRVVCSHCGTFLFWQSKDLSQNFVNVFALDVDLDGVNLDTEVFIDEKPAFYHFGNATQQLTGQQVVDMFQLD